MRYQFYREHKYVSALLNDVERLIAKTDFQKEEELKEVREQFEALAELLRLHAEYENHRIHPLLKQKQSPVYEHVEKDHAHQELLLKNLRELIEDVSQSPSDEKVLKGYQLYLSFRKFVSDNLAHLHEEETILLPELQRLYSDEELQKVEAETYHALEPQDLVQMIQVLFPHMNSSDQKAILEDFRFFEPEKFAVAWEEIKNLESLRGCM